MATDIDQIVRNLIEFHDLGDRTVVAVGAGGGQLAEYARPARQVIAIDLDAAALDRLAVRAGELGLADKFTLVQEDMLEVRPTGDVVLFEFSLHEMPDPGRALAHAQRLAPDVVVIDHDPASPWSWFAAEEAGVEAAWAAVARRPVRRWRDVEAFQLFPDYGELEAKMARQGSTSLERIRRFRDRGRISIPMPYRLALL